METKAGTFQDDLDRYLSGPVRLSELIASTPPGAMDFELPDRWTIRQTVHHLADGDYLWKLFIMMALGDSPMPFEIPWYWMAGQTTMAARWNYHGREIQGSLALLDANRRHTYELLSSIPKADAKILAIRWPDGDVQRASMAEVIASQADHVDGHMEDICHIIDQYKKSTSS